ncbi:MAG: YraN family protein [Alicyclobacillus sp.]|nr:YraN family protein [Alicyclobacillus sp.]
MSTANGADLPRTGRAGRQVLGRWGEQVACEYLERTLGWRVQQRNWRGRGGELDLVAQATAGEWVLVEVRTRQSGACGGPEESVSPAKRQRLWRLAVEWRASQRLYEAIPLRVDVIAVYVEAGRVQRWVHLRGAVEG